MKHTPAPWKYEEATKTIRSAKENYWLATMDSWDGAVDHKANARLIAASPTLYSYVMKKAKEGCQEAKSMLASLGISQ